MLVLPADYFVEKCPYLCVETVLWSESSFIWKNCRYFYEVCWWVFLLLLPPPPLSPPPLFIFIFLYKKLNFEKLWGWCVLARVEMWGAVWQVILKVLFYGIEWGLCVLARIEMVGSADKSYSRLLVLSCQLPVHNWLHWVHVYPLS